MIYCPECERGCSPNASTCPGCGHPLAASPDPSGMTINVRPMKIGKPILIPMAIVSVILTVGFVWRVVSVASDSLVAAPQLQPESRIVETQLPRDQPVSGMAGRVTEGMRASCSGDTDETILGYLTALSQMKANGKSHSQVLPFATVYCAQSDEPTGDQIDPVT